MSRQAKIETDIKVKDVNLLKESVNLVCKEVGGIPADRVRYYSGEVFGIKIGHIEIGVVIDSKGKISFVGEDIHLYSEIGQKVRKLVLKNYSSLAVSRALRKMGYSITVRKGQKNVFVGVRA